LSDFRGLFAESLAGFLREVFQGLFSLGGFDRFLMFLLTALRWICEAMTDFLFEIRTARSCWIVDDEQSMAADTCS
jgi:hypothetical protein